MRSINRSLLGFLLAVCILGNAFGQNDPFQQLNGRLDQLERDNIALRNQLQQQSALLAAPTPAPAADPPKPAKPEPPKYPVVRLTGFFHADALWASQDQFNPQAIVAGAPLGDIQDGADFRRARLAGAGDVFDNVGYMLEMDFALPGRPNFMDVYLELRDVPVFGAMRVGQWRHPVGMDALTGVKDLIFLERAFPLIFTPFRQIGAGYLRADEELGITCSSTVFRFPSDPYGGNVGDNGGYGTAARLTGLLWDNGEAVTLHVGGSGAFIDPATDILRFRTPPEVFVFETPGPLAPVGVPEFTPFFVDTGNLPSNNYGVYGVELAGTAGPLFVQSEWMGVTVDRIAASQVNFWAGYGQVSYVLTGEHHSYNRKAGVYGRILPDRPFRPGSGWGAWEVAARWSYINLTDKDVLGNRLQELTFGVNWYLNPNTKFQYNYLHSMLDSAVSGDSTANLFAVRAQLDF